MSTRNGKIARLANGVREELNERLFNGEEGTKLVDWLNGLKEVKAVLKELFEGRPISEQNLSEWKQGGYVEWEARRELLADAGEMKDYGQVLGEKASAEFVDQLALVLAARYGQLLLKWNGEVTEEVKQKVKVLGQLSKSVLGLQRGRQRSVRAALAEEQQEWARYDFEQKVEAAHQEGERQFRLRAAMNGVSIEDLYRPVEEDSIVQAPNSKSKKGLKSKGIKPNQTKKKGSLKVSVSSVQSKKSVTEPVTALEPGHVEGTAKAGPEAGAPGVENPSESERIEPNQTEKDKAEGGKRRRMMASRS